MGAATNLATLANQKKPRHPLGVTACLSQADISEMAASSIAEFEKRVSSIPAGLSAPFHNEARQLEAELLMIYKAVVHACKNEDDLTVISALWGLMAEFCDTFAQKLSELAKSHPDCAIETYHDRILDLRNKCHRLQTMHG